MDYFKVLKISENATKSEIEEAYKLLITTYDPSFNTSPVAHKRYREIQKAYKMLQNKNVLSLDEEKEGFTEEENELFDYDKYFSYSKDVGYIPLPKKDVKEYENLMAENLLLDEYKYQKEIVIDYLDVILKSKIEVLVYQKENCINSLEKECDLCNGIGKSYYQNKVIKCPKCNGLGKIHECNCHNHGHLKKEKKVTIDLGIIDTNKPLIVFDTYINFKIINKEKIKESKEEIYVTYDLSKEEILNGFEKVVLTEIGLLSLKTKDFLNDYVINYKDKKLIIHFNRIAYDGEKIYKTLLIDKKDLNDTLYLNLYDMTYALEKDENHFYKVNLKGLNGSFVVEGYGEKGYLEGKDGDLNVSYYACNNFKLYDYQKPIRYVETSFLYNFFGGKENFGFKGKNYLIEKGNEFVILSGQSKQKSYIKDYLWMKIIIYLIWLFIPLLGLIMPINKDILFNLCVVAISYSLLANILLRIKV